MYGLPEMSPERCAFASDFIHDGSAQHQLAQELISFYLIDPVRLIYSGNCISDTLIFANNFKTVDFDPSVVLYSARLTSGVSTLMFPTSKL